MFGTQNTTRTNLCTDGHSINATINGNVEYVRLTRSPLTDDGYWRELWVRGPSSGKTTLDFFMTNQTDRNPKEYRLFLQTSTSKWTPDVTVWHIHKQSELVEDISIERQRMDSELKTLMHLVAGETYRHELYHIKTGETLELGELKADADLNKFFLPELGIVSQGEVWLVNHVRASNYTSLIVNISKITPSNINLHVYDLISTDTWYNHTGVTHIEQVIPIMANRTYYVTGYSTKSRECGAHILQPTPKHRHKGTGRILGTRPGIRSPHCKPLHPVTGIRGTYQEHIHILHNPRCGIGTARADWHTVN